MSQWLQRNALLLMRRYVPVPTRSYSYRSDYNDDTSQASFTFTACDIGSAPGSGNRLVVVAVHPRGGSARSISSATIGGVSAAVITQSATFAAGIIAAIVNSGTTADVAITFSGSVTGCSIETIAVYGISSQTPVDSGTATVDTNQTPAKLPYDSFLVFAKTTNGNGATFTVVGPLTSLFTGGVGTSTGTRTVGAGIIDFNQFARAINLDANTGTVRAAWGIFQ